MSTCREYAIDSELTHGPDLMVQKRFAPSRDSSPELIDKRPRRGLHSLGRTVSPPPASRRPTKGYDKSTSAAIEAGEKSIEDHVSFYSSHLLAFIQPAVLGLPRLPHQRWIDLYKRNAGSDKGCHFVVHQHDHPIAGTHYDLRLQCNPTSSISFAIMYGLPGDPNSRRLNRNATETRVHCLWNHLIETASYATGSMLIWDTGEFEVLPYHSEDGVEVDTDEELGVTLGVTITTQQQKLKENFQNRKLKLRLHGSRLPSGYTVSLRLTKDNYRSEQPVKPSRRRKRTAPRVQASQQTASKENERSREISDSQDRSASELSDSRGNTARLTMNNDVPVASDNEGETIRVNNAYIGATNDIGSVHQRKWYLSIDRRASGFEKTTRQSISGFTESWWHPTTEAAITTGNLEAASGFEKFVVEGRDVERSVVTGRLASDILRDEGVVGYVPRGLWRPVTE